VARSSLGKPLGRFSPPKKVKKIVGDGNCFFRAICFAITGDESQHANVRQLICDSMVKFGIDGSDQMRKDGEWGGSNQIFATANWLGVEVFVWSEFGPRLTWHVHKPKEGCFRDGWGAIYLDHSSGNHYNFVQSI
jgi:hypothetical protein